LTGSTISAGARAFLRAFSWDGWTPAERATLLFVVRDGRILLIEKHRGLGQGKINGPGGRLEPGETPRDAAIREVEEEIRIRPTGIRAAGELRFQFVDGYSIHVYVFRADGFLGEPESTEEATPLWSDVESIPYERMWEDDAVWLPLLLRAQPFAGRFVFDGDRMLTNEVELRATAPFPAGGSPPTERSAPALPLPGAGAG
jgi:8-oxo-dGTP diphosphatase